MTFHQGSEDAESLRAVIDALYARLPAYVPPTLSVCLCGVCMTPETLAQIIATPVRDLSPDLIAEYTNSAHAVPQNPDDLRALLPRYLDLMAQGQSVSPHGIGVDLRRFGDGRRAHAMLFDPTTETLLNNAARLMLLQAAAANAQEEGSAPSPLYLAEVFLVGGWIPAVVMAALDALFAGDHGPKALVQFLTLLGNRFVQKGFFDFYALTEYRGEAIPAICDWLNHMLQIPPAHDILLAADPEDHPWAGILWDLAGSIAPGHFRPPAR